MLPQELIDLCIDFVAEDVNSSFLSAASLASRSINERCRYHKFAHIKVIIMPGHSTIHPQSAIIRALVTILVKTPSIKTYIRHFDITFWTATIGPDLVNLLNEMCSSQCQLKTLYLWTPNRSQSFLTSAEFQEAFYKLIRVSTHHTLTLSEAINAPQWLLSSKSLQALRLTQSTMRLVDDQMGLSRSDIHPPLQSLSIHRYIPEFLRAIPTERDCLRPPLSSLQHLEVSIAGASDTNAFMGVISQAGNTLIKMTITITSNRLALPSCFKTPFDLSLCPKLQSAEINLETVEAPRYPARENETIFLSSSINASLRHLKITQRWSSSRVSAFTTVPVEDDWYGWRLLDDFLNGPGLPHLEDLEVELAVYREEVYTTDHEVRVQAEEILEKFVPRMPSEKNINYKKWARVS